MKTGIIIIVTILVLILAGYAFWLNSEDDKTEEENQVANVNLANTNSDYSSVESLSDCIEVECALQLADDDKIADFELKAWLQNYYRQSGEFADCQWNWDLFEERIQELKTVRKNIAQTGSQQIIGITCNFLQPEELQ